MLSLQISLALLVTCLIIGKRIGHTDSVEHFDDFRRRKSRQNDDFRGRFYVVAEFFSLGAENGYCLTIFGAENRAKMTILGTNR